MANFTDAFGATVTDRRDGSWKRGGVTLGSADYPVPQAVAQRVFNAMAPDGWAPPQVATTTVPAGDFVERFTSAEVAALIQWNPSMVMRVTSAGTIDTGSQKLRVGFAAAVVAGKLTQARADQILDLSRQSP